MTHRIISGDVEEKSDGGLTPEQHTALIDRLARVLEADGGKALIKELGKVSSFRNGGEPISDAVQAYLDRLPEPQRTMFHMRTNGCSPSTIAASIGMRARAVCIALAKIYAEIRHPSD